MKQTLIVDAGSTKSKWALIGGEGKEPQTATTAGVNALLAELPDLERIFSEADSHFADKGEISGIYFYGAGCVSSRVCERMNDVLSAHFGIVRDNVHTYSDLLGASRSLFGRQPGITCILGTGSNSCYYDGNGIVHNVPSLGYILGDEGSGSALGKRLIREVFKGGLSKPIKEKFLDKYSVTLPEILDKVYREPAPNRYLASLVPFISENIFNPYIYSLVYEEMLRFFRNNVNRYDRARLLPIKFTGSIAYHFRDILEEAASAEGLEVAEVTKDPIDGLINYHRES